VTPAEPPGATGRPHVALAGPCASGKSTLAAGLRQHGYRVSEPAQEHSYVPDMWQRMTRPDILIYLDAGLDLLQARRPHGGMSEQRLRDQTHRLRHARAHADLVLDAGGTAQRTLAQALAFLDRR
jgi:deoxyadenosine/deoxycytidine kinase